jgi:hypothetical protein
LLNNQRAVLNRRKMEPMKLLASMIVSGSLALGGVALMKLYARPQPPMKMPCPATVSITVAGTAREVPLEGFMVGSCAYGADGVSAMIVP